MANDPAEVQCDTLCVAERVEPRSDRIVLSPLNVYQVTGRTPISSKSMKSFALGEQPRPVRVGIPSPDVGPPDAGRATLRRD